MSDDDDDLKGRQLLVLLAFFCGFAGVLLLIAWAARPNWLWDGPLVAFAVAGGVCYPARFLVERFAWWKRLAVPTRWTVARRERAKERERRRFSLFELVRRIVGGLLVLGSLAIAPVGISVGRDDERLARSTPVQQAVVVSVEEDKWSKNDDVTVKVARPGDGGTVEISGGNDLHPRPAVGDSIGVIVDPDDPENVLAADGDWNMHWYWYLLGIVISLVLAGMCAPLLLG